MESRNNIKASLTVEAALVLPLFIFFYLIFLYFIQIFTIQEYIQEAVTQMGLSLSKAAYVYSDFTEGEGLLDLDSKLLEGTGIDIDTLGESAISQVVLKQLVKSHLNMDVIKASCIREGFNGISFYGSEILDSENCIDIIIRYQVSLPIKLFRINDMRMIQRIKLRAWNGHQVPARYTIAEEETEHGLVYITETGTVYHLNRNCSHINISVDAILGVPTDRRNSSGGKYYPCETCCDDIDEVASEEETFYITASGVRYHKDKNCPTIKRTVREIPLTEVGSRQPCKRCGN